MAESNIRRRAFWRAPRQPPPTPYEMTTVPLGWQNSIAEMYQQPQNPDPFANVPNAWDDPDHEIAQHVARGPAIEGYDYRESQPLLPKREDPFSDFYEEPAPTSSTFQRPYSTDFGYAPIKQEPQDEVLASSELQPARGYMGRSSPFELDSPRGDRSFMDWYPKGDATITYLNENGEIEALGDVSPWMFEDRCPLLAHAFEPSRSGPKLFLEALTPTTAQPFLRFLYTGSYAVPGPYGDIYEDVPTSLLLHCRLYRLGDIYDLLDLKQQANVNVTRQCEFGCSSPNKPIDLCAAIKFVYEHLSDHANLIDTIICYAVTCFLRHRLAEDFEFRTLAYSLRPFHQDLCKESMKREFEDDTAAAIIQMPFEPYVPETYASREDIDCVFRFHGIDEPETSPKKRKRPEMVSTGPGVSGISLALRQRADGNQPAPTKAEDTESDEDDIHIGSKRRLSEIPGIQSNEPSYLSDSEYEVVAGPAAVQELSSDSESDGETVIVEEKLEDIGVVAQALPIRARNAASSDTAAVTRDRADSNSGSDSDWSLV